MVAQLTSNKAKEDAAIAWVMDLERAAGREPRDTRYTGAPADIESPPRLIEVKSFGTSNGLAGRPWTANPALPGMDFRERASSNFV